MRILKFFIFCSVFVRVFLQVCRYFLCKKKMFKSKDVKMVKRNGFDDSSIPLCRFGPGGEYVSNWPKGSSFKPLQKPIGSLLNAIAKMLDSVINEELMQNSTLEKIHSAILNSQISDFTEGIEIELNKSNDLNASPVSGLKAGGQFTAQKMLFDNPAGTCGHSRNKPNNGVRAYRKLKRKRPAFGRPWQGSLFEPYQQSLKVA